MKAVTLKEIEIVYGLLYDLGKFCTYVSGYRPTDENYDVYEGPSSIKIYYAGSHWLQMPVAECKIKPECK